MRAGIGAKSSVPGSGAVHVAASGGVGEWNILGGVEVLLGDGGLWRR